MDELTQSPGCAHTENSTKLNYLPIFVSDDFISRSHMMEEHPFSQ